MSERLKSPSGDQWSLSSGRSSSGTGSKFGELVSRIAQIGLEHHAQTILENSRRNAAHIVRTIREIRFTDKACLLVSAGPSLYRQRLLLRLAERWKEGLVCIVATDGAYIQCLKAGITPDWVITIDPHPTRIVRWFGDPDYESNSAGDDYFARQDLAEDFRKDSARANAENIRTVDAAPAKLAICCAAAANVVERTARFDRFWFAPLVDSPDEEGITRTVCAETGLPALNTGGTVGTAAWAFASQILKSHNIAVVGMDYSYPLERPLQETQEWNLLKDMPNVEEYYPRRIGYWGECYTSPTYAWYMQNFLDLLEASDSRITNCSEGGILMGERIDCMRLEEWLGLHG